MDTEKLFEIICGGKGISHNKFVKMINGFEEKFNKLIKKDKLEISNYFGIGSGPISAKDKLLKEKIINKEWFTEENKTDFKGIYVFYHNDEPFYVGISQTLLNRIDGHVKGNDHHSNTLAYKIALVKYEYSNNKKYTEERKDLSFKNDILPNQKFNFIKIEDNNELALFEIYCSMRLKTSLNIFATH